MSSIPKTKYDYYSHFESTWVSVPTTKRSKSSTAAEKRTKPLTSRSSYVLKNFRKILIISTFLLCLTWLRIYVSKGIRRRLYPSSCFIRMISASELSVRRAMIWSWGSAVWGCWHIFGLIISFNRFCCPIKSESGTELITRTKFSLPQKTTSKKGTAT